MLSKILKGLLVAISAFALFFFLIYVFQYVWNITVPAVFGLKEITYLQALGLIAISRVLFGGFGFRWANSSGKDKFWKERMKLKMGRMTDEEKEEFKRRVMEKCGNW